MTFIPPGTDAQDVMGFLNPETLGALLAPVERRCGPDDLVGILPALRWLARAARPACVVELGVGSGVSCFALCAALEPPARYLGIDTWEGADPLYRDLVCQHGLLFASRARLLRDAPESAARQVADGTVDLLHLSLEADPASLERLIEIWLPKMSGRGVLALSGIERRDALGGAWRVFAALAARYPHVAFRHDGGLGLLLLGAHTPAAVAWLAALPAERQEGVLRLFVRLGQQLAEADAGTRRLDALSVALDQERLAHRQALTRCGEAQTHEEALRRQLEQKQAHVDMLQAQISALYRTTSWRITAPLRRLRIVLAHARAVLRRLQHRPLHASSASPDPKQLFKERTARDLAAFLDSGERLSFPVAETPRISIVLVLYNQAPLTFACLKALIGTLDVPAEVIIVDNASSDQTGALLERLSGVTIIQNTENLHFLRAVNQGAAEAQGRAILLLNNDACLRPGALTAAEETLYGAEDIGAVGGKIVLLDGSLQEAGSIVWNDGTCLGYGRGRDPDAPEFQFRREVDYCSGAFLLVKRPLFEALGRFDAAYAPAYYEETDFCMRLRAAGYRILYDPRVEILHYEFGSSSSSEQALELQRRNHAIFASRHRDRLMTEHLPPNTPPLFARMVKPQRGRILVIEDRVPYPSLGAGYPRSAHILATLHKAGWFITFYPLVHPEADWSSVYKEFPHDIEFLLGHGGEKLNEFLSERAGYYDTILVCRPHNMKAFSSYHRKKASEFSGVRIIYDAEAIFAPREAQWQALAGTPLSPAQESAMLREEMDLARPAQAVLTVNEKDAAVFRAAQHFNVKVLGHALEASPGEKAFQDRRDLLFVGALDDDPSPNTDSIIWFVNEVMPKLDGLLGRSYRLVVAGRCRAERVRALASPRVVLLGRVGDLSGLFNDARLFVAPTRYAAGVPHKIHESVSHGLPVVATSLLASQLGWRDGAELLVADDPRLFAMQCARLYTDEALWKRLRDTSIKQLAVDCNAERFERTLLRVVAHPTHQSVTTTFGHAVR